MNQEQIISSEEVINAWALAIDKLINLSTQEEEDQMDSKSILIELSNS